MIRTRRRMGICIGLLTVNLVFIFGNSMLPGDVSDVLSHWVGHVLHALGLHGAESGGGHGLLRKAAHFSEFACLGLLLGWLAGMLGERGFHGWSTPLLFGMLAACMDEAIQALVPARGPSVIDVWIDTCGVAAGIGCLFLGYHWIKRRTKRKKKHLEVLK